MATAVRNGALQRLHDVVVVIGFAIVVLYAGYQVSSAVTAYYRRPLTPNPIGEVIPPIAGIDFKTPHTFSTSVR